MPPSLFAAPANRVPLSAYAGRPHPSRPAGAGYGGQGSDLYAWARQVVEKVRVASVGGRLRFLPWFDPYTEETPEIRKEYRLMLREPTIKAALQTKILSVISQEIQVNAQNPDDEREQEVAAFGRYLFKHLKGDTRQLGWDVLHPALIDGVSVCEKVREENTCPRGRFKGKRLIHAVKPKDTHYLQLGIDAFRNITCLRGTGFNAGRVWSPTNFVIFSYFPLYGNPSGLSDFRAAYRAYWCKDTAWKLRSLHLQQWTGPYLRGTYATESQKAALEDAFNNAAASTWLTVPAGVLVDAVDLSMRGTSDFKDAIADADREMLIAIVGAHLQNLEGQTTGGRGNTKVHREIGELIEWWLAATLADVYKGQILMAAVEENYHDAEVPDVTVGAITDEDMLQKAKVFEAAQKIGMGVSKREAYQSMSLSRPDPDDPDDTLEPPGGGGGPKLPGPGQGGGEGQSPFAEPRRFCQEGPNKGKPGPCPKPKEQTVPTPGKPPKATAEEAHDHIERVRQNPTPEGVRAVAETLSRMTVKDVNALKAKLGIRAGGPKAALVEKVAHEATRRLTVRERYVREARALGYSVKDLTATAQAHRQVYNEVADEAGRMLRDARAQYQQFTGGGRLFRGMSAFRSGDYTEIPHFDQIAESLQRRHPDLLPGDAQEGYERLFTLLSAGPPARMGYEQSLEKAMSELQSHGPQERRGRRAPVPPEEEIPFAEADPGRLGAILDAMLDAAGDPGRLAVLAEMADDPEGEAPADDDPTPPDPAARARVAGWVDDLTRGRLEGGGGGGADRFAEGDGLFHGPTPPGPGWVQVGVGPHGGKRWKKAKGGAKGAGKPEGKGLATGAAVPASPRGGEAVGGKRPHKGLATGRAVPKAPRGEGNPEPEQSAPRGAPRAAGTAKDALPDEPAERRPGRDRKAGSTRGDTQATDAPRAAHKSRTAGLEEAHAQAAAAYEQAHAAWEEETARLEKGYEAAHAAWEARGEKRDRLGDLAGKDAAGLVEQLAPVEGTLGRMRAAVPKTDAAGPGGRLAARGEAAAYAAAALSTWDDAYGPGGQLARGLGEAGLSADDLAPVLAAAAKGRASLEKTGQRYLAATDRYLSARAKREEHEAKEPPDPFDLEEPDPDDDAFPDQASYDAAHAGWQQEYDSAVEKQDVWQEKMDTLSGREEELAQVMEELTDGLDDEWVEQDERVTKALDKVQQGIQRRVEKEEEADPEPEEPEPPPEPEEPDEPDEPEEPEEDDPRAHPHAEGR